MPNLIVERGREKGATFELRQDQPSIAGRDPAGVQIVISDPAASRRHFQVAARNGKWFVADLGSRNHTYVNEEKVEREVELASGDRIQVGETVMSFLDEDKADRSTSQGLNGKEIGGYQILERVGRGGMGTVFKARQISLHRIVALKVLASKFARDPKFVERFQSEARAAGQLNHPNVVQVFDVGQLGGLHYFSMEFMEGGCVQDLLTAAPEGRLEWKQALPMILDAARGLVFAEKRGIIHRDIKPDNLMLTSEQRVKIGDLGLAKKAEEGVGDQAIFGTPHFIAPEQAQGKEVTHAADLYALGATFYRMVTGKTPFGGETVKEILKNQISTPHRPIAEAVPGFPADLSTIVDRLMAKKVENRYQSATKLVEDLEAFQLAHQIELSGARKLNKPLMIALIVIALAAAGVGVYFATRPPEVKTETIEKWRDRDPTPPVGPVLSPEQEAKQILLEAQVDRSKVDTRAARLGEVSLEKEAEWLAVATEYEQVATKHSDPRAAREADDARAQAKKIRERLQALKDDQATRRSGADKWWQDVKAGIAKAESAKNWAEAIRLAEKAQKDPDAARHMQIVKEAGEELTKAEPRLLQAAQADYDATLVLAEDELKKPDRDVKGAMRRMRDWATALEQTNPTHEKLKSLAASAREWVEKKQQEFEEFFTELLEREKAALVDAFRALRTGGSGGGAVFDYQFDAAAMQLQSAAADFKTYLCRERAMARVAHLKAAQAAWASWVRLFAEGKLYNVGDELKGLPGAASGVTSKVNLEDKPTLERFTVDTVFAGGAMRANRRYPWAELSREELWSVLVKDRLDRLPWEVAWGLAWMFVELGHDDAASALRDRAVAAGLQMVPDEVAALQREIMTLKEYEALRDRSKAGGDPNEVVSAVYAWRRIAAMTDAYIDLDGRPAKELTIFPQDKVDEFTENLGERPK